LEAAPDISAQGIDAGEPEGPVRVIEPASGWRFPDLRELWEHRDLLYLMVRRDIAVRYRQSAVGVFWAVLQPIMLAAVFSVFLSLRGGIPSEQGIPYPVFVVSGIVFWLFFGSCITKSSDSTVQSADLISRVYFPRAIIPIAAVIPPLVDFAVAFPVVIATMLLWGVDPSIRLLLLPLVIAVALTTALGLGLWLSALHVRYRDVKQAVPFMLLVGLFLTPTTYPFSLIPTSLQPIYALNPMVGVIEGYRWTLIGGYDFPGAVLLIPLIASVVLLISGALFFEKMETQFADVI
jgi:lipopolysaccharide transport system permease protein